LFVRVLSAKVWRYFRAASVLFTPHCRQVVLAPGRCSASRGKSSANSDIVEARFIEIIPGVRVVYEVEFVSDDPAYANTVTMTWEVTAVAGGSRVDITADNVPDGVSEEDHAAGLNSSLRNLADYLHA
jgi:uncharacterized protein YndB with AHSA1/START domain